MNTLQPPYPPVNSPSTHRFSARLLRPRHRYLCCQQLPYHRLNLLKGYPHILVFFSPHQYWRNPPSLTLWLC